MIPRRRLLRAATALPLARPALTLAAMTTRSKPSAPEVGQGPPARAHWLLRAQRDPPACDGTFRDLLVATAHWPGLDDSARYQGRDLAVTTDFRNIIADVLERHFRLTDAQLARVLPAMPARKRVGLFG